MHYLFFKTVLITFVICHIADVIAIAINKLIYFEIFLTMYTNAMLLLFFKIVLVIFLFYFFRCPLEDFCSVFKIPLVFSLWEI